MFSSGPINIKQERVWLTVLLLLALFVRLPGLNNIPGPESTRTYTGLLQARYFYTHWDQQADETKRTTIDAVFQLNGFRELPLLPALTAVVYQLIGHEAYWPGRLLSVLAWLMGGYFLYRFARLRLDPQGSLVALAFYLFAPFGLALSRTFQPDPVMVALILGAWWQTAESLNQDAPRKRWLVAGFTGLAVLVKPMAVFFALPVAIALLTAHAQKQPLVRNRWLWQTQLIPALLAGSYYVYEAVTAPYLIKQAADSFMPRLFLHAGLYLNWWQNMGETIGYVVWVPALILAAVCTPREWRRFFTMLLIGYVLYAAVFNHHVSSHDYYSLPLIPVVALLYGCLFARQPDARRRHCQRMAMLVGAVGLFLSVIIVALTGKPSSDMTPVTKERLRLAGRLWGVNEKFFSMIQPTYGQPQRKARSMVEIGRIVQHSTKCLFLTQDYGAALMYHGQIAGKPWLTSSDLILKTQNEGIPAQRGVELLHQHLDVWQPEYFIVTHLADWENQADIRSYMEQHYPSVATGPDFHVYRLTNQASPK